MDVSVTYAIARTIFGTGIDAVDAGARPALAHHGYGILAEIDPKATMKKVSAEMPGHRVPGARNPEMAHQAIGNAKLTAVAGAVRGLPARPPAAA
ncbi:hypothetical protein U879_21125 [Defluviimonas sp. 20V17]|uniref:Uncharacterized protein n=1 Tax=Allgaiera indica TaxID=765699 RepID=A0AAN4UT29_9RHOB|nr:hypothetical protein U879_21125 [Defluviimonas sp. 20V17]GHE03980.1 hypothetical protein GCM10008024_29340 [Allgaiera indica]SDX34659.1 hypothetical protein SAMN05444006_11445 [Allgaiera indica]